MISRTNTKELLSRSLLELCRIKPLEKISIIDITKNCSMKRESFYYHFTDKYALMLWIYKSQTSDIIETGILERPLIDVWTDALTVLANNGYFYKQAFQDQIFQVQILNSFIENIMYCLKAKGGEAELTHPEVQFAIRFYANGLLQTTIEWLGNPQAEKACVISQRMCAIMPHILSQYYIF